jgi:cytochrome P450
MTRTARPPGPKRLPLLGSLPALSRDPLGFLSDMARNYGDVAYTRIGSSHLYMINDPALIEEALVGRHRECVKDAGTRELIPLVGHGLLTSEGDFWRKQRKLSAPPLQPKRIASYADTMVACSERAIASFRDEEVRDVHVDMMGLTLEIVGKTLLGVDTRGEAERMAHIVEAAMAYFDKQLFTWHGVLPQWVITPERVAFRKAVVELDRIVYGIIERSRAAGAHADHLLARLAQARDDNGEAMSDEQLRDEAVTMLLAGHETTAIALSFAVYALSEYPEAAARLRAEIDAQLGGRPALLADLPRLKYLDAVMRETLRLYPPAWLIGREIVQAFELGGYLLQPKEQIMMSPYTVQRDPRFFPDPERFLPERWLQPPATPLPKFTYFPFGGGPRVCIGNHFAMMEIALVLATLLQQVELTVVPGFELKFSPVVTLRPANGVPVLVRRRRAAPAARRSPWTERAPAPAPET